MQQEGLKNIVQELEIFLDVIEENSDSIVSKITQRYKSKHLGDDENIFLDIIEEDVSEIVKATKVIRDKYISLKS